MPCEPLQREAFSGIEKSHLMKYIEPEDFSILMDKENVIAKKLSKEEKETQERKDERPCYNALRTSSKKLAVAGTFLITSPLEGVKLILRKGNFSKCDAERNMNGKGLPRFVPAVNRI